ncbi:hypothetical protein VPH35_101647 [Triticum aestivum]
MYHWLCIDPGKNKSDGTSLLRVGVHQAASLPAASNLTHVYGAYVPENSNGSDHTCEGNQVGLDAPFIRNVDENYPSSPDACQVVRLVCANEHLLQVIISLFVGSML